MSIWWKKVELNDLFIKMIQKVCSSILNIFFEISLALIVLVFFSKFPRLDIEVSGYALLNLSKWVGIWLFFPFWPVLSLWGMGLTLKNSYSREGPPKGCRIFQNLPSMSCLTFYYNNQIQVHIQIHPREKATIYLTAFSKSNLRNSERFDKSYKLSSSLFLTFSLKIL